jgi:hypothetical protein
MKADRRTKEFQRGVDELVMFALENGQDGNKISCPCVKCAHSKSWKARIVRGHLFSEWHRSELHVLDLARGGKYGRKSACR